ncbi:MAG TPA: DNA alkylation repair protein [Caldisericia bacterium]|nr:DNA alkylation repair protein [Caldisericia bacterium]
MEILEQIREELVNNSDEKTKTSGQRFFKEQVPLYGVKTALVSQIAKKYFKLLPNKEKNQVFSLCEKLWQSSMMEESFIACNWSYQLHKEYTPQDFAVFEHWVNKYLSNWASCDTLCNHNIGTIIEMYPDKIAKLKTWTKSPNRWVKRASAVSLVVPARKGLFLAEIFEIAEKLLIDPDDMVQKGYGWMLKEASRTHQQEVFLFVQDHKKTMPRTSLRYAIEKMPQDLRQKAMAK